MLSKNQTKEIQFLHHKKYRDQQKKFIVEGIKLCREMMQKKSESIESLYCTEHFFTTNQTLISQTKIKYSIVEESGLKKISLLETPNEALIVAHYFDDSSKPLDFQNEFSLYLDDIRDPGNMGTILRLADWFGVHQIFASPNTCDCYNPKVVQSSMGAILRVNISYQTLPSILENQKIDHVYGALFNSPSLYTQKLSGGLIVIGNEANGISEQNIQLINKAITIPASPANGSESLNAAMATSIILSEFFRQLKA